jgi:tetratricopeptide (TPR) repeat protein
MSREDGDPKLEGAALNNLGLIADERGDYRHSLELYSEALEIFQRIDFPSGQTDALGNIGGVHLLLGRYREARDYYKQALSISERESLKFEASIDLGNLALCYLGLGEIEESLRALDRALALAREIGAAKEEADWSKARGAALQKVGKYELALKELGTALDSYERAGNQRELVEALSEIGGLHVLLGDSVSGEAHFERAAGLARSIGYSRGEIHNLIALGRLRQTQQRLDEAIPLYEQAYERSLAADDRSGMAASALRLADIHRQRSRFDEALVEARCALATARGVGARPIEAQALATLGNIARQRDKLEEALQQYDQAWPIAEATGRRELGWRIRYRRGQVLEGLGRTPEAVTAYDQAVEIIEGLRLQLSERRFRAGYIDDRYQPYLALIRLLLEIGQTKRAFSFSEKLRARAYLDLLAQGEPPIRDEDQRWAEAELRERIRKLERTLEDENNKPPEQRRPAASSKRPSSLTTSSCQS